MSSGVITPVTLNRRAQFFDAKLAALLNAGIDGYIIWDKINESSSSTFNLNSGRFGVGPGDQTESVTRGFSGLYGNLRSDWEVGGLAGAWPGAGICYLSPTAPRCPLPAFIRCGLRWQAALVILR